jgi:DNA-binding CsgD family transcriptional regulator
MDGRAGYARSRGDSASPVAGVLDEARATVAWVPPAELGADVAGEVSATAERLAHLARRGVHVRVLCPDAVAAQREYVTLFAGYSGTLDPRVSRHGWPEHVLVDERVAVLPGPGPTPVVVRARPVVSALAAVFHGAWGAATRLPAPVPDGSRLATEPARRILDLLGAGYRDAAAARELGLSTRTYRRHVAELMTELHAATRFQAGARAAHLGLLPQESPTRH